jgi:hypothetical protein
MQRLEHYYEQCLCVNSQHTQSLLKERLNIVLSIDEILYKKCIKRRENQQ